MDPTSTLMYCARPISVKEFLKHPASVVNRADGTAAAALCYLSHDMQVAGADAGYVDRILKPAQAYGFPKWYLDHIASFL
jgi:hypothetical protein